MNRTSDERSTTSFVKTKDIFNCWAVLLHVQWSAILTQNSVHEEFDHWNSPFARPLRNSPDRQHRWHCLVHNPRAVLSHFELAWLFGDVKRDWYDFDKAFNQQNWTSAHWILLHSTRTTRRTTQRLWQAAPFNRGDWILIHSRPIALFASLSRAVKRKGLWGRECVSHCQGKTVRVGMRLILDHRWSAQSIKWKFLYICGIFIALIWIKINSTCITNLLLDDQYDLKGLIQFTYTQEKDPPGLSNFLKAYLAKESNIRYWLSIWQSVNQLIITTSSFREDNL